MTESPSENSQRRAQYGEFATPEQQQARRLPTDPARAEAAAALHLPTPEPAAAQTAQHPKALARMSATGASKHPVDKIVTMVLLAGGLFILLNSIPGYLNMPEAMQQVFDSLGAGTYGAAAVASSLGVAAIVAEGVLWLAAAFFAFSAIRRGHYGWWIALLGGVLTFIVMMVIVSTALFADPTFADVIAGQSGMNVLSS